MEIINGIFSESFWWVAPILVTLTTALAGLINQGFKVPYGWLKQLISWVLGAGLSCAAWGIKMITFGDPVWLGVVCLCIVVGLASNGIYDIPTIKNWISSWFTKQPITDVDSIAEVVVDLLCAPESTTYESIKFTDIDESIVSTETDLDASVVVEKKQKSKPKKRTNKPKTKKTKTEKPIENA